MGYYILQSPAQKKWQFIINSEFIIILVHITFIFASIHTQPQWFVSKNFSMMGMGILSLLLIFFRIIFFFSFGNLIWSSIESKRPLDSHHHELCSLISSSSIFFYCVYGSVLLRLEKVALHEVVYCDALIDSAWLLFVLYLYSIYVQKHGGMPTAFSF